jgi:NADPH:quinone reductase-like Zn-dependent oxidoreductase
MQSMRAAVIHGRGGPEMISVDEVPIPEVGPADALIKVHACGLNRMDIWARTGPPQPIFPWKEREYPLTTGGDVAGEVVSLGDSVTSVSIDDRVIVYPGLSCGHCEYCLRGEQSMCPDYHIFGEHTSSGGFAEFVVVPAKNLERLPEGVDSITAAAVTVGFTTAWRLIHTAGQITAGDDVLVLAAGGSVGVAAMELARNAGARVFAGASTGAKRDRAVELGAAAAIDTTSQFSESILELTNGRGVDIVVDSLGATWEQSIRSLSRGGRLVCCGATLGNKPTFDIRELYQRHRSIRGAPMGSRDEFNRVVRMFGKGLLNPVIDSVYALNEIQEANRRAESRESFGKIVVKI